jgi:hypothetical protein
MRARRLGTKPTNWVGLAMSVDRGRSEVARRGQAGAIGTFRTCLAGLTMSVHWGEADMQRVALHVRV